MSQCTTGIIKNEKFKKGLPELTNQTRSHYVAQAALEPTILLPQPPHCWDYRHVPLCLALAICNLNEIVRRAPIQK
jgi:hypothetical protein